VRGAFAAQRVCESVGRSGFAGRAPAGARQVRGSLCLLRAGVSAAACLLIFPLTHIPTEQQQSAAEQPSSASGKWAGEQTPLFACARSLSLANKCSVCAQEPTPERDATLLLIGFSQRCDFFACSSLSLLRSPFSEKAFFFLGESWCPVLISRRKPKLNLRCGSFVDMG
jgi:hypothetical protein